MSRPGVENMAKRAVQTANPRRAKAAAWRTREEPKELLNKRRNCNEVRVRVRLDNVAMTATLSTPRTGNAPKLTGQEQDHKTSKKGLEDG